MKRYIKKIQKKLSNLNKSSSTSSSISSSNNPSFSSDSSDPTSVLPSSNDIDWVDNYGVTDLSLAFHVMDRDGDGKIGKRDLKILLFKVCRNLSEQEVELMVNDIAKDENDSIELSELKFISDAIQSPTCDDELRETFNFFDADHDGKISAVELYGVFRTIVGEGGCSLDECERMINGVDRNGDGFVCFQDFSLMMEAQMKS